MTKKIQKNKKNVEKEEKPKKLLSLCITFGSFFQLPFCIAVETK